MFQIPRDLAIVVEADKELFPLAGVLPQLPRFCRALGCEHRLSDTAVGKRQIGIGHGEIGINFDHPTKKGMAERQGARPTFMAVLNAFRASSEDVVTSTSGIECFSTVASDSPSRGLSLRTISLRAFRTSSLFAAWICSCARMLPVLQFLARRPKTYWLPRLAIEPSRTAALAVRSQTCCAISAVSRASFGLSHQRQRLLDLLIRNQAEERGLLKLHGQPLAQRVVKHRVAGLVLEIREDNRVRVGEWWRAVNIEVPGDGERQQSRGGGHDHLPACDGGDGGLRTAGHPARIRVPLQALEVRANVRRVLVAQIPIFFEALVDDPFQFRRHVGIQAHGRHRRAVENRIENGPRAVPSKWPRARRHFIEHDAEREQIGAGVQRRRPDLLGRHVRHGPERVAWIRQQRLSRTSGLVGDTDRPPVRTSPSRARNPESSARAQSGRCSPV